jgi:hypothetical protein
MVMWSCGNGWVVENIITHMIDDSHLHSFFSRSLASTKYHSYYFDIYLNLCLRRFSISIEREKGIGEK